MATTTPPNSSPVITPDEIIQLANEMGYSQRRAETSATLFFLERDDANEFGMPPVRINVYYTTRSLMTHLNHANSGNNELWRSNAYTDLAELKVFFQNPRIHTGKGYRNADKAVRGCVACGETKERTEFSTNQWRKGPDANKCLTCSSSSSSGAAAEDITSGMAKVHISSLTADALQSHNSSIKPDSVTSSSNNNFGGTERRQFNCPDCPKHGRGNHIFFKKVPVTKPICKCPKCKKASRGRCQRLYPVPKEQQRGYGLFRCHVCKDKWGSSRALANIGQECYTCADKGRTVSVTPFRMEIFKRKKKGAGGGMKRVPREPIGEDEPDEREYGEGDNQRFIGGGAGGGEQSYDMVQKEEPGYGDDGGDRSDDGRDNRLPVGASSRVPTGYVHRCAGCATGACTKRKVPKSKVHEVSDGNTVSTRASVVTNSSIDKSDFFDRDEDFSGFVEDSSDGGSDGGWVDA